MSDVFTPLTPATLASGGASSTASTPGGFKPLPSPAVAGSISAAPGNCAVKPTVTVQRKGNVVTSIRVQCACGQVLDINCQY